MGFSRVFISSLIMTPFYQRCCPDRPFKCSSRHEFSRSCRRVVFRCRQNIGDLLQVKYPLRLTPLQVLVHRCETLQSQLDSQLLKSSEQCSEALQAQISNLELACSQARAESAREVCSDLHRDHPHERRSHSLLQLGCSVKSARKSFISSHVGFRHCLFFSSAS